MKDQVHIGLRVSDALTDTIVSESGASISWFGGRVRLAAPMIKNEFKSENTSSDEGALIMEIVVMYRNENVGD